MQAPASPYAPYPGYRITLRNLGDKAVSNVSVQAYYGDEKALSTLKHRHIPMNIDGITAVIFCELGFEPELGRGLFILSRAVGILAHAWEQKKGGRRLMGPMPREIPFRYSGSPLRSVPQRDGDREKSV